MTSTLGDYRNPTGEPIENTHTRALREGRAYNFFSEVTGLAGAGGTFTLRFTTGDLAVIFEGGDVTVDQEDVKIYVYDDSTFTAGGTLVDSSNFVFNMSRISQQPTNLVFYETPTINSIGSIALQQHILGVAGQNVNRPGFGAGSVIATRVLKPNTEHVFQIVNDSVEAARVIADFFYHEVDPRGYRA